MSASYVPFGTQFYMILPTNLEIDTTYAFCVDTCILRTEIRSQIIVGLNSCLHKLLASLSLSFVFSTMEVTPAL